MFGYLNLGNPTLIGNNEAQESVNCRVDRGRIEYKSWAVDKTINTVVKDNYGRDIYVYDLLQYLYPGYNPIFRKTSATNYKDYPGVLPASQMTGWNPGNGVTNTPKITLAAYGSNPYPPGIYDYLFTLYDEDSGEESRWTEFPGIQVGTNQVVQFENFPGLSAMAMFAAPSAKPNLKWRIYRRSIGSFEYLLVTGTPGAWSAYAGPYQDVTPESDLGLANDSYNNKMPWEISVASKLMVIYNGKLFFRNESMVTPIPGVNPKSAVFFSRTNQFGCVLPESFYAFQDEVTGLFTIHQALAITTLGGVFVLFGNDENDFQLKKVDDCPNGAAIPFGAAAMAGVLCFLGASGTTKGDGIFLFDGSQVVKISDRIASLFPVTALQPYIVGDYGFHSGAVENRFFVAQHASGFIVYDVRGKGFTTGDSTATFRYRTKEFGKPGQLNRATTTFIRGIGNITAELYGDGELIDSYDLALDPTTPETEYFRVPGSRHYTFSWRFIGQPTAQVHEFGRLE